MTSVSTTLDITVRLHLSGNIAYTTVALSDAPQRELTSLELEGLALVRADRVEGPAGAGPSWVEQTIQLTPAAHMGITPQDRYLRLLENLLTALNGEAEEALLEEGE